MNAVALAAILGLFGDINVAGSIYLNQPTLLSAREEVLGSTARGMNAETAVKLVADVNESVSASAKVCFGCHGFQADMAYFDWIVDDAFSVRAGRFPVPFGEFYLRHDAANHRSATKPLPYEMGRMLRRAEFNLAIVPEPYPDNGVELFGTFRGDRVELAYSLYAVAGLKGSAGFGDLDFIQSRNEYFADNNRTPTVGGRLTLAFPDLPVPSWRWFAVGISGLSGYYDDDDELIYRMLGIDLYTRYDRINLRGEIMMRRTEIPNRPQNFRQTLLDLWVQREGFYLQLDGPMTPWLEWLVRWDGFRRSGPVPVGVLLEPDTYILRYTAGVNLVPATGVKLKINYEYWDFEHFEAEHMVHTGLVGTF